MIGSRSRSTLAGSGGVVLMLMLAGCGFVSMDAKGTWEDASGDVVLTFTQEGLIAGTDGCNGVKGTWEEHGKEVTITMSIDEENDCPEIDPWLVDPTHAVLEGNTMKVYGAHDTHLGDLTQR